MESKQLDLILQLIKQQSDQIAEICQNQKEDKKELIDLIKEVKSDLTDKIDDLRFIVREDHKKLDEVYDERKFVTVKFGWQWGAVSLVIAFIASGMTAIFS